jgi:hypothetical protein
MFNEISKEDIDRLYSIIRRTDLQVLITKLTVEDQQFLWVDA